MFSPIIGHCDTLDRVVINYKVREGWKKWNSMDRFGHC